MRVGPSIVAARVSVDETITAIWRFANALGLLTDDINERTAAEGVTVDGLLIKDGGIPEAAITAHEAALALLFTQLGDEIGDSQVPESAVTQHEAALAILEAQIADGSILARLAGNETISGNWAFDIITDFQLGVRSLNQLLGTSVVIRSDVVNDSITRYQRDASGKMSWGPGDAVKDTTLFRAASGELATGEDLNIGGTLDLAGDLEISVGDINLTADVDNLNIGSDVQKRITGTSVWSITGIAGGRDGRMLFLTNVDTVDRFGLRHEDSSSSAGNRIITPTGGTILVEIRESAILVYDATSSRWRFMNYAL